MTTPDPAELREVVDGWPSMLWFKDGRVETFSVPPITRDVWCGLNGVPHTDRHDPLALLCEPYLDTEFTPAAEARTQEQLAKLGFGPDEVGDLRDRLAGPMLRYNAMVMDWVHLGLYDVLAAMPGPAAETQAWCNQLIDRAWRHQGPVPPRRPVGEDADFALSEAYACAAGSLSRAGWSARRDRIAAEVRRACSEPWRHYHNLQHLAEAWALGRASRDSSDVDEALAWTVLFHDHVYVPGRSDNEEESAKQCDALMQELGAPEALRHEVGHAIRWSARHQRSEATTALLQAFFDADMGVLGLSPARYATYVEGIASEYAAIPPATFRAGRRHFLAALSAQLGVGRFFFGLHAIHEQAARANVSAELAALSHPAP